MLPAFEPTRAELGKQVIELKQAAHEAGIVLIVHDEKAIGQENGFEIVAAMRNEPGTLIKVVPEINHHLGRDRALVGEIDVESTERELRCGRYIRDSQVLEPSLLQQSDCGNLETKSRPLALGAEFFAG